MTIDETKAKINRLRKLNLKKTELYYADRFVRILAEVPRLNLKNEDISYIEKELSIMFIKDEIDPKTIKSKLKDFLAFLNSNFSIIKQKHNLIYTSLAGGLLGVFFGLPYLVAGLVIGSLIGYLLDLDAINNNRMFKTNFDELI